MQNQNVRRKMMGIIVDKEFKYFLKNADSYGVRFEGDKIEVTFQINKKENKNGWIKPKIRKSFSYQNKYNRHEEAFFWEVYPQELIALNLILRKNDEIRFYAEENNNQYLTDAGLFNDELVCSITRNGKQIVKRMMLIWSCTPNNSARAIKK
jgi:hypothetical protein